MVGFPRLPLVNVKTMVFFENGFSKTTSDTYLRGSAFWVALRTEGWLVLYSHNKKKTVQFSRTSLSYRPIAALSTGVDRDPRLIRVFAQIRGEIFAFLGPWPSVIARSRVQILDLAPLYRTVGAALSTGCYVVPRQLSVRRDSIASSTTVRRRSPGGRESPGWSASLERASPGRASPRWRALPGCRASSGKRALPGKRASPGRKASFGRRPRASPGWRASPGRKASPGRRASPGLRASPVCMHVCMYLFKRQLEARRHLEGARHLDGGRHLETGRRASSLVRSRDIAFGSG